MGFENSNPDTVKVDLMTPEEAKLPQQVEIDLMTPDKMAAKSDATPEKKMAPLQDDDGSKLTSLEPGVVTDALPQMPDQKEGPSETKAATSDAKAFDAESATVKTGIDQARALLEDVKSGKVTDDKAVIDAFKTAKEANENAKQLVAKADTPEKQIAAGTLLEEAGKIIVEFWESVKDIEKKEQAEAERKAAEAMEEGPKGDATSPAATPPEATTPEPKKSNMDKIADGLGKAFEKLIEFFGKVSEAISNALDKAGVNKKNMLKLFGNVPLIGDVLRSKVQVDDIHAQIEKTFGKGKLLKTDKDSEASNDLKKAFDNETKPAGSTENFEQFVQKRIDAVKASGKMDQITIEDLVNITPVAPKPADAEKPTDKIGDEKKLTDAGLKEDKGVWKAELPLGKGNGGVDITSVEFRKNGDKWEWRNSSEPADKWLTNDRFPTAGADGEVKTNREKMNQLAADLGIPEKPAAKPADKPAETPEQQKETRKTNYMKALANAFNNASGTARTDLSISDTDDWKSIASKIKTALANETFDIENIKLEIEGNTLEATDTSSAGFGLTDKNLIDNWSISTDPAKAIKEFLDINTVGLDSESANSINRMKDSMRGFLKNDMATFEKDVAEATPAPVTSTDMSGDMSGFGSY